MRSLPVGLLFHIATSSAFSSISPPGPAVFTRTVMTQSHAPGPSATLAATNPIMERFSTMDCMCFDVDSTVCCEEGIDELANHCGVYDEVKRLTCSAMDGNTKFQDSLRQRLELINPTLKQVEEVIASGVMKLSPGIKELVDILHGRGVRCYLISGGFTHMIHPIAKMLSISPDNVYANELRFDEDGAFQSFNPHALTCCSGGKGRVIAHIREFNGYKSIVMCGDGATDLETSGVPGGSDSFIGYGGVVERPAIREAAHWYVTDFGEVSKAFLAARK